MGLDGEKRPGEGRTDGWSTPTETTDYRTTPSYEETVGYLKRLQAAYPTKLRLERFGRSGEGRDLLVAIVSSDGVFDPEAARASGRVVLLVQNGIHAGEPDGKDACLALLRDLLRDPKRAYLLEHVILLIIPVYIVDGHERRSPYHRLNQNGPERPGWRANATNLNLNRDYMKVEAPETRHLLGLIGRWRPDFFVDDHVTDGADFQYDVTFVLDTTPDVFPPTADWIRSRVTPDLVGQVEAAGHLAFPGAIFLRDDTDPSKGLAFHENPPRFSTGRMVLENRPGLLVEMHMLKEYRTRVTGNYELLRALLDVLHREHTTLVELNRAADEAAARLGTTEAGAAFPLIVSSDGSTTPVRFRGRAFRREPSEVSGAVAVRYGSAPWETELPAEIGAKVVVSVPLPAGYIVSPAWSRVVEVLELQGVVVRRTTDEWTGEVERYLLTGMQRPDRPFEGRYPILRTSSVESAFGRFGRIARSRDVASFAAGSAVVLLDQRLSKVAVHWLEPEAPDSAFRWGFFDTIFEQKEGGEAYVGEPLAREAMARDPGLRAEFEQRLRADPAFATNPRARLAFFYDRSLWGLANRVGEYPVGRLLSAKGLPIG